MTASVNTYPPQTAAANNQQDNRAPFTKPLQTIEGKGLFFLGLFVACLILFCTVTLLLTIRGRSLLWQDDGVKLWFTFLMYEGEWLRSLMSSLFTGTPSNYSAFSLNIGFGADAYQTMAGVVNDPFNIVSVFCPPQYTEYLYELLVFVRLFAAAAAFSCFCFSRGIGKPGALAGSLCYISCGYCVLLGVFAHSQFLDFAIVLPLAFWGVDKIFCGGKPWLFIATMAFSFIYSVYFTYMTCFILLAYCVINYFVFPRKRSLPDFLLLAGKVFGCIVASLLISGLFSFPIISCLLSMGRVGLERNIAPIEDIAYFQQLGASLLGARTGNAPAIIGPVSMVCACLVLFSSKIQRLNRRGLLVAFGVALVASCFPPVSSMLNGFGYPTNRWLLVFGFCGGFAAALAVELTPALRPKDCVRASALALAITLASFIFSPPKGLLAAGCYALATFFAIGLGSFGAFLHWKRTKSRRPRLGKSRMIASVLLCVFIVFSSGFSYNVAASANYLGTVQNHMKTGETFDFVTKGLPVSLISDSLDDNYRIDRATTATGRNVSVAQGYKGMDFFSSMYPQNIDDFRKDLGICDNTTNFIYNGTQSRFVINSLLGARYFIAAEGEEHLVPYGYRFVSTIEGSSTGDTFLLYENDSALPLAFTYDTAVSQATYNSANTVEKQELLATACIIDTALASETAVPTNSTTYTPTLTAEDSQITIGDGFLIVKKAGSALSLDFEGAPESETYICMEGLSFFGTSAQEATSLSDESLSREQLSAEIKGRTPSPASSSLLLKTPEVSHALYLYTSEASAYSGMEDFTVNMGYADEARTSATIRFNSCGIYFLDSLFVSFLPTAPVSENIEKLLDSNRASITFGSDRLEIQVAEGASPEDSDYLFLSIPYAQGWTATIDGVRADILRANTGFMALEIDGRAHEVELEYETPGARIGAICTSASIALIAILGLFRKRRAKNTRQAA